MSDNRTNEFFSLAKAIQVDPTIVTKNGNNSTSNRTSRANVADQKTSSSGSTSFTEVRQFHVVAAGISKDIANTSLLLKQLTDKIKHKSLFSDNQNDMNQLVIRIKQSIENLNSRLDVAAKTLEQHKKLYGKKSQITEISNNVISELQNEFATAASQFKDILQQRTDSLKDVDTFKKQLLSNNSYDDNEVDEIPDMTSHLQQPPPVFGHQNSNLGGGSMFPTLDLTSSLMNPSTGIDSPSSSMTNQLPRPHGIVATSSTSVVPNVSLQRYQSAPSSSAMPAFQNYQQMLHHQNSMPLSAFDIQRMEEESGMSQQLLQTTMEPQNTNYLQSRVDAMSTVESNIVELGTIFQKLAGLVNEHRELIQRVEDNVEDTNANVLLSMNVLTDTLMNLKSNKMLAIRLFAILTIFIISFIIFFA